MKDFSQYKILHNRSIREAFKKTDLNKKKFILVTNNEDEFIGIITDGDFRRAIWNGVSFEKTAGELVQKDFHYLEENYRNSEAVEIFQSSNIRQIPIIRNNRLVDIIFRDDFDIPITSENKNKLDCPVVIMAGGRGKRLDPFTRIIPKPLIPVGEKPIIEIIIDKFVEYGLSDFILSINYKASMIKAFFNDFDHEKYKISYLEEDKPLGTGGSLKLLGGRMKAPYFISNCDIIVEEDYSKIYNFHIAGQYSLTLVCVLKHQTIPYGVCEVNNGGELKDIKEKPEYDLLINSGLYVINPDVLSFMPDNEPFDLTDLTVELKANGKKVGVYPVSEKSWIDIGQWAEYKKTVEILNI
jgi:dTDP-glucose pyrophosphorylase